MDKPPIGTSYFYIELNDDWSEMTYVSKTHVMDQLDRYNLAAGNWALSLDELKDKADLLLKSMTLMEEAAIASLIFKEAEGHD